MLRGGRVIDVFDLAERRRIAAQRITVTFAGSPPPDGLDGIDGAPLLSLEGDRAVFETHDGVDALLKCLARYTVADIETHKPTMLAQPVSRRRLFVERVAAFAIGAALICALASLGFVISAPFIDLRGDVAVWELGLAPVAALPLALACGSLGLLAGALTPTRVLATGLVAAETVTVYFFDVLADLVGSLEPLRYLSPFFYSDAKRVLVEGAVPWHAAVLLGASVLLTALALAAFEAREVGTGRSPLRALLRRERRAAAEA